MDDASRPAAVEPAVEPTVEPTPGTSPVTPTVGPAGRSTRARWTIAGLVVGGTVGAVILAAGLLGARGTPEALRYIPADTLAVVELRPELPGDQHAAVGELLAHFPGFKDQSNLDQKIDETLDLLVDRATDGGTDYASEVEPLLAGPAYVGVRAVTHEPTAGAFVVALTSDGNWSCEAHAPQLPTTTETHAGVDILVLAHPDELALGCALDGRTVLVGDVESIRDAIDAKRSGDGVAGTTFYRAAAETLRADRLGSLVVDVDALLAAVAELDPSAASAIDALPDGAVPAWLAMSIFADPNGLVMEASAPATGPRAGGSPGPSLGPSRISGLASRLPASTVAMLEVHDIGAMVLAALDAARDDPEIGSMLDELEASVALFGGVAGLTGWIGDGALVATLADGVPAGGLVIRTTDPAAARSVFDSLRNLLVIAGSASGISVDRVEHDGIEITLVDLGDPSELLGDVDGMAGAPPFEGGLVVAWALEDDIAVVGLGEGFVVSVLDVEAGSSLADMDPYRHAIELAGEVNDGAGYVDLAAVVESIGERFEGAEAERWRTEVEPWLAPLEGAAFISGREDGLMASRFVLTVR